jgi:hypothetical protein
MMNQLDPKAPLLNMFPGRKLINKWNNLSAQVGFIVYSAAALVKVENIKMRCVNINKLNLQDGLLSKVNMNQAILRIL